MDKIIMDSSVLSSRLVELTETSNMDNKQEGREGRRKEEHFFFSFFLCVCFLQKYKNSEIQRSTNTALTDPFETTCAACSQTPHVQTDRLASRLAVPEKEINSRALRGRHNLPRAYFSGTGQTSLYTQF